MCIEQGSVISQLNQFTYSVLLSGHKICSPKWGKKENKPLYHSLWYITKGSGEVIIDGVKNDLTPGKVVFFAPGMICDKKTSPTEPLEFYFIRFSYAAAIEKQGEWHFRQPEEMIFPLNGVYTIKNTGIPLLIEEFHALSKRRGATTVFKQKILFQELLLTFVQDFYSQHISRDTKQAIEETINYISHHYFQAISLTDLANLAGLSKSHYSRLFKKYIGYSPIDYLTHLRMDRAKELLVHSDIRIKEVSQQVGYEDELYFSRIFKKIVGVSPTQFTDEHRLLEKDGFIH
jgi:AraC family transcriptional regulator, transcriptional activator for feuABC-ybbA operon